MARLTQAERDAIQESQQPQAGPDAGIVRDTPNEAYPESRTLTHAVQPPTAQQLADMDKEFFQHQRKRNLFELVKVLAPAMIASASPGTVAGLFSNDPFDVKRIIDQTFLVAGAYADKLEELAK